MASPDLTAGQVMDAVAAVLNDVAMSTYPYTIQIPYLNMALRELQEFYELNEVPTVATVTSAAINIPTGQSSIVFNATPPVPELPDDLIEPSALWVSQENADNYYGPIQRVKILPRYEQGIDISSITGFTWQSQTIRFFPATIDLDVKIDYIRSLFATVTLDTDELDIVNGQSFLQYRTGAIIAELVEENKARAAELNGYASLALDRSIGIGTKGRQASSTRRRPFRSGYKMRGSQ